MRHRVVPGDAPGLLGGPLESTLEDAGLRGDTNMTSALAWQGGTQKADVVREVAVVPHCVSVIQYRDLRIQTLLYL